MDDIVAVEAEHRMCHATHHIAALCQLEVSEFVGMGGAGHVGLDHEREKTVELEEGPPQCGRKRVVRSDPVDQSGAKYAEKSIDIQSGDRVADGDPIDVGKPGVGWIEKRFTERRGS
jgi:hypothetical protein